MSEKTIRRKAKAEGYTLKKYRGEVLVIDICRNAVYHRCGTFAEVAEWLELNK